MKWFANQCEAAHDDHYNNERFKVVVFDQLERVKPKIPPDFSNGCPIKGSEARTFI